MWPSLKVDNHNDDDTQERPNMVQYGQGMATLV